MDRPAGGEPLRRQDTCTLRFAMEQADADGEDQIEAALAEIQDLRRAVDGTDPEALDGGPQSLAHACATLRTPVKKGGPPGRLARAWGPSHSPAHARAQSVRAAVLFAVIFLVRMVTGGAGNGVTLLYVVPIVIIAVELGRNAGFAAGLLGLGLFATWAFEEPDVGVLSYVSRGIAFVLVGAITGHMSDRMRASAARAEVRGATSTSPTTCSARRAPTAGS